jgi:hypothetical protein
MLYNKDYKIEVNGGYVVGLPPLITLPWQPLKEDAHS